MKLVIKKTLLFFIVFIVVFAFIACKDEKPPKDVAIVISGNDTCYVGSSITLEAIVVGTEEKVTWEVSDESIATIEDGVLTGLKEGTVIVKATVEEETSEISIKVKEKVIERDSLFCGINLITEEPTAHEKVEFALVERNPGYIKANYNPFDYSKLNVYAVFTSPNRNQDIVAIGFWYRDYVINLDTNMATGKVKEGEPDGVEIVNFTGDYEYRLRFQPSEEGKWTYKVYVEYDGFDITEELNGEIEVKNSTEEYKGLIKVDKSNNRTFMYPLVLHAFTSTFFRDVLTLRQKHLILYAAHQYQINSWLTLRQICVRIIA